MIRRIYGQNQNISLDPQLLLCDSDVVWERDAIYNAVCLLEKNSDLVSMSGTRSIKEGVLNVFDGMEVGYSVKSRYSHAHHRTQVLESVEAELFYRPFQLSCHVLKDLPGYFTFVRFAAFRDIELRYFDQVDDVEHTKTRYHSLSYGNNSYLGNGEYRKYTLMPKLTIVVLSETFGASRMGYSPHVRAYHNSSNCWSDYFYTKRRYFLGRVSISECLLTYQLTPAFIARECDLCFGLA